MGLIRGFSGELGAILKLVVTGFIGYGILGVIVKNLDPSLIENLFFPATIFALTYIFVNFLAKITITPIVMAMRSFTPFIIDKIFGIGLGIAKAMTMTLIFYNLFVQMSDIMKKELPEWFVGSYSEIALEEANIVFSPYLPDIKDLLALRKAQKGDGDTNSALFNKFLNQDDNKELLNSDSNDDEENSEESPLAEGLLGDKLKDVQKLMKHYQFMDKLDDDGNISSEEESENSENGEIYGEEQLQGLDALMKQLN